MELICSRCDVEIAINSEDSIILHGICDECADLLLWPNRPLLKDFLDKFDAPIVAINKEGNVISANTIALGFLDKELVDIDGLQGGNVFECAFAKLPEGCGKTLHCDGCTIRNTVMSTLLTGESHLNVPAGLSRGTTDEFLEVQLMISTEKVKEVVMLRIDRFGSC